MLDKNNIINTAKKIFWVTVFLGCLLFVKTDFAFAGCGPNGNGYCLQASMVGDNPSCQDGEDRVTDNKNCSSSFEVGCCVPSTADNDCAAKGGECVRGIISSGCWAYQNTLGDCTNSRKCCSKQTRCELEGGRCTPQAQGAEDAAGGINICGQNETPDPDTSKCSGSASCCKPGAPKQTQTQTQNATPSTAAISSSSSGPISGLVPCRNSCTLCHIILGFKNIFDFFLGLLFIATMLVITVSGVFYMVSTGSKGMIDKAKKAITYGLLAFVVGMGSWLFVNLVMEMVGYQHPMGGSWWQFTCDTAQTVGPAVTSSGPTLASGARTGTGSGSYQPSGDLNSTVQKVLGNYMTMDGMTYGASFPSGAQLAGKETMNCGSTCREAWMEAGLPDFWNLPKERWDGDPSSLKPGDICLFNKSATGIDHAFMIMDQNGVTTAAGGNSNTIRTSADGLNSNINKLNGNTQNLYVFHIANYLNK
jgi:hypothetical protein